MRRPRAIADDEPVSRRAEPSSSSSDERQIAKRASCSLVLCGDGTDVLRGSFGRRGIDPYVDVRLRPKVRALFAYARRRGLKVAWVTLTSGIRTRKRADVLNHLLAAFERFRYRAWRRVPAGLKIVGLHGRRPSIHLVVVLPVGMSLAEIRYSWGRSNGFTSAKNSDATYVAQEGLASYCAAQSGCLPRNYRRRLRTFEFRAPPAPVLVCVATDAPSVRHSSSHDSSSRAVHVEGVSPPGSVIVPPVAFSRRSLPPESTSTDEVERLGAAPSAPPLPAEGCVSGPESASVRQGAVPMGLSEVTTATARRAGGRRNRRSTQHDLFITSMPMTKDCTTTHDVPDHPKPAVAAMSDEAPHPANERTLKRPQSSSLNLSKTASGRILCKRSLQSWTTDVNETEQPPAKALPTPSKIYDDRHLKRIRLLLVGDRRHAFSVPEAARRLALPESVLANFLMRELFDGRLFRRGDGSRCEPYRYWYPRATGASTNPAAEPVEPFNRKSGEDHK